MSKRVPFQVRFPVLNGGDCLKYVVSQLDLWDELSTFLFNLYITCISVINVPLVSAFALFIIQKKISVYDNVSQ